MSAPDPAEAYERVYVPAYFAPVATAIADRAGPRRQDRVLDVACGTGIAARTVRDRVGPLAILAGVDVSPAMIGVSRSLVPEGDWREASAQALPFPDRAFDLVLCSQGLMFFPERPRALAEMRRVLASNGRLVLSTWRSLEENPIPRAIVAAAESLTNTRVDTPFTLGDDRALAAMIAAAGFADVHVDVFEHVARFPDARGFVRMSVMAFASISPTLAALSNREKDGLVASVEKDCDAVFAPHRNGNGLSFPMRSNIAVATVAP